MPATSWLGDTLDLDARLIAIRSVLRRCRAANNALQQEFQEPNEGARGRRDRDLGLHGFQNVPNSGDARRIPEDRSSTVL